MVLSKAKSHLCRASLYIHRPLLEYKCLFLRKCVSFTSGTGTMHSTRYKYYPNRVQVPVQVSGPKPPAGAVKCLVLVPRTPPQGHSRDSWCPVSAACRSVKSHQKTGKQQHPIIYQKIRSQREQDFFLVVSVPNSTSMGCGASSDKGRVRLLCCIEHDNDSIILLLKRSERWKSYRLAAWCRHAGCSVA